MREDRIKLKIVGQQRVSICVLYYTSSNLLLLIIIMSFHIHCNNSIVNVQMFMMALFQEYKYMYTYLYMYKYVYVCTCTCMYKFLCINFYPLYSFLISIPILSSFQLVNACYTHSVSNPHLHRRYYWMVQVSLLKFDYI